MSFKIDIRKYNFDYVPYKVKWINDPIVNRFLHYNIPIDEENERKWLTSIINDTSRHDCVIEVIRNDSFRTPVGLVGLIHIDDNNKKAEFYISIGEHVFQSKGIAYLASVHFLEHAFKSFCLNKIYLYTEEENIKAQRLFERVGFIKEGLLRSDLIYKGRKVNRYVYGLLVEDFQKKVSFIKEDENA